MNDAKAIARKVATTVAQWRDVASGLGAARPDIDRMASTFEHADLPAASDQLLRSKPLTHNGHVKHEPVAQSAPVLAIGVDGCRAGWFFAELGPSRIPRCGVVPTLQELVRYAREPARLYVDIPIGPPDGPDVAAERIYTPGGRGGGNRGLPCDVDPNVAVALIRTAKQPTEIAKALSIAGRRAIADRIEDLDEMTRDGGTDESPMVLASLRELALFLLSQPQLADPEIGISPGGLLLAEWASRDRGVLAMEFRPDGLVQFAAVAPRGVDPRPRVHGKLPRGNALGAVRNFIPSPDRLIA